MKSHDVIRKYFTAMRKGPTGAGDLFSLFSDDAVYVEPFTDEGPAIGIEAIRRRFLLGWEVELPDLELDVLEIRVEGSTAWARWECRSPGLDGPVQGEDRYHIADGLICRLEVRLVEPR